MFKLLAVALLIPCAGCESLDARADHFKFYLKHKDAGNFVVTNDKHPQERFAVIVRPHQSMFSYNYHF